MTDHDDTTEAVTEPETKTAPLSRRSILSALGAGATVLALGGAASPTAATGEDNPAAEYADEVTTETTATSDGDWSADATWDNGRPGDEANVRIESGTTVTVDDTTNDIATLDVAGTLEFPTDSDSELRAETIVTRPDSTLEIGTESTPIEADSEARITFVHHDVIDESVDPNRISKGLVVMGDVSVYGAETSGWHELASAPTAGESTLELAESPTGWQADDTIVVPGLNPDIDNPEDEERAIASISGTTVELESALEYDHSPPETDAADLSAYALNLTRNVVFESEEQATDPENEQQVNKQGHVMIMSTNSSVHNARFKHVGRTNKRYYFDNPRYGTDSVPESGTYVAEEPNPRARYGFHYHQTGIDDADSHEASGLVVQNSPGWGLVNHHSYADVTDCVTYEVLGSGFVAEGGDERGSFTGCFALRSRGSGQPIDARQAPNEDVVDINDFGHAGHGFWLQGPVVTVEDNVAAGHRAYAYSLWNRPLYDEDEFTVDDFRTHRGDTANFPLEYAEDAGLLPDAMESQLDSGELTDSRVATAHLNINSFDNNVAFASAGGLDVANHNFDNPHTDTANYSQIANFTAHSLASFVDRSGTELYPQASGNNWGMGGNTGVSIRYSNNVTVTDAVLVNDGGHGVRRNFYPRSGAVENSTIEGFEVGVQTIDTGDGEVTGVDFRDTSTDIYVTSLGDIGAQNVAISDIEFSDSATDITLNDNWSVFMLNRFSANGPNLTYEGQTIYHDAQDAEFVPYESERDVEEQYANPADWDDLFGLDDREAAEDELVGMTNAEYQQEYGTSIYGEIIPPEAESSPHIDGGVVGPDNAPPSGDISVDPGAALTGDTIQFDAAGVTDADGTIDTVEWELGDGSTATGTTVEHSYDSAGEYDIEVVVTDDVGDSTVFSATVEIIDDLNAPADPGTVSNGVNYDISDGGSGVTDQIDFDPFSNGGIWQDSISYDGYLHVPADGAYRFTVVADNDATLTIDGTDVVTDTAGDGGSTGAVGLEAGLHSIAVEYSEEYGDVALSVEWDGPSVSAGEIPADRLYVQDPDGEIVESNASPTASFSATTDGLSVSVDASGSSDSDGSISSYEWSFGDGASATGQSASHTYDTGGDYDVTLTVTDDDGVTAASTQTVSVAAANSDPTSSFLTTTDGLSVSVDASGSSDSDGSISSYEWTFGDGTSATGASASHTYDSGGDYDVTLTVTDDDGATASTTQTVSLDAPEQTVSEAIDANDDGDIDDAEILEALDYWENEATVPGTGGETISDAEVLDLIEQWQTDG